MKLRSVLTIGSLAFASVLGLSGAAQATTTTTSIDSVSWAGYVVSGANGSYQSVSADWTVPTVKCVSGTQFASFWIGLDGYSSDSVEQTGIDADCSGGTVSYSGWYDLYPASPVYFGNAISAGDSMSASVTFSGTTTYTFVLADATADWSHTITKSASGLARSSAEVVTQGPGPAGVLTDFGKITFTKCEVNGTSLGGQDPTAVTMVDGSGKVMVSPSAITAAGKFTNTWLRGT